MNEINEIEKIELWNERKKIKELNYKMKKKKEKWMKYE